jgi:hypothetical protein
MYMTANCCVIRDQVSLRDEVAELAAEYAARRFTLCWIDVEDDDGGIFGWGMVLPSDVAVVTDDDGHLLGVFSSAERARRLFGRRREVVLVWFD